MLRHLALVLIVVMAAAILAAVGWLLVGGLTERVGLGAPRLCLTAMDAAATPSPGRVRGTAILEDAARGRRVRNITLWFRFDDGYVGAGWINPDGLAICPRLGGQTPGRHEYEVFVSELSPEIGLWASATAWVEPPETPVLWVDAAAVVAVGAAEVETPAEARAALQALASGRRVVYLVAADTAGYASARERIGEASLPAGPAVWVEPGAEQRSLRFLARTWPRIVGAVLCSEESAAVAKAVGKEVFLVRPAAGATAVEAARLTTWDQVRRRMAGSDAADGEGS